MATATATAIITMSQELYQGVAVVNAKLRNVPEKLTKDWPLRTPGNSRPEVWFYKK